MYLDLGKCILIDACEDIAGKGFISPETYKPGQINIWHGLAGHTRTRAGL